MATGGRGIARAQPRDAPRPPVWSRARDAAAVPTLAWRSSRPRFAAASARPRPGGRLRRGGLLPRPARRRDGRGSDRWPRGDRAAVLGLALVAFLSPPISPPTAAAPPRPRRRRPGRADGHRRRAPRAVPRHRPGSAVAGPVPAVLGAPGGRLGYGAADGFLPVEVIRNPVVVWSAIAAAAVPAAWFALLIAVPGGPGRPRVGAVAGRPSPWSPSAVGGLSAAHRRPAARSHRPHACPGHRVGHRHRLPRPGRVGRASRLRRPAGDRGGGRHVRLRARSAGADGGHRRRGLRRRAGRGPGRRDPVLPGRWRGWAPPRSPASGTCSASRGPSSLLAVLPVVGIVALAPYLGRRAVVPTAP